MLTHDAFGVAGDLKVAAHVYIVTCSGEFATKKEIIFFRKSLIINELRRGNGRPT